MAKNYYAVLGVPQDASDEEIRRRFRALVRERHPDRFPEGEKQEAEAAFQELTEAFNILTHPERRRSHDADLTAPGGGHVGAGGPGSTGSAQTDDRSQRVRAFLARGVRSYKEGQLAAAAESFERAAEIDPGSPQAWYNLALTCSRQKTRLRRAVEAIEQACELEPMKISYRKLAGRLCAQAGQTSRAEKHYKEALTWGGSDPEIEQELKGLRSGSKKKGFFGGMI